jgi:TonB family protein
MASVRLVSLAMAAALVVAATLLAVTARYRVTPQQAPAPALVVSERAPAPAAAPSPRPLARLERSAPRDAADPSLAPAPAPLEGEPPQVDAPEWLVRPANPERFYPRAAFVEGVEGRVELACFVETDGRLTCEVASEAPLGHGFGDAALALARAHVMRPAMRDGAPVRARYRMVVPFRAH